jgi:O-antigen/teichoic acid export membrane protein
MEEQSLKDKTVKGVGWSMADAFLGRGITFLVGIVLARLLTPSEYGLIGITTIFVSVLDAIVDSGFSQALIRKKDATQDDYNTMFITNMVLSVFMFLALFFSSPAIARFFDRPELASLTRVMGSMLIINALSITQNTVLTKRIDFKTKTKASVISAVSSGVLGICMAFMGFGVWALVGQQLSKQFINTICLWFFNKWWPNLSFSKQSFSYMWGFGWKMLASSLLNNIWRQLYQVVVGKCYSPATLGQYSKSKEYSTIFSANIDLIVNRVSYPVLSEIQDDKIRMKSAYRKIIKTTMFVTAVFMVSMGAVAEPLIYCLIGPQWHEAATYLPLICISMSLYPLHSINLNMLKVHERSDLYLVLEIIKKIIAIGPICIGIFIDIYWMVASTVITGIVAFFLNSHYSGKLIGYSSWMQIKDISPSYALSFLIAVLIFPIEYLPLSYWIILPLQIIVGTIVFFIVCKVSKNEEYDQVKEMALTFIGRQKRENSYYG